jgi:hypothetical protein
MACVKNNIVAMKLISLQLMKNIMKMTNINENGKQ